MADAPKRVFSYSWMLCSGALFVYWLAYGTSYDRLVMVNTVTLGLLSALVSIPLGAILANSCARQTRLGKLTRLFVVAFALIPIVFQVSCWDAAFGRLGWITAKLSGTNQPIVSGWIASIWIHAVALAPQLALIFLVSRFLGTRVQDEQALLDSRRWQVFLYVTLPRQLPVLGAAVCWSIISCSREIAVTDIYQVGTLAEQVYLGFSLGQFDSVLGIGPARVLAEGNSLSIPLQILTIIWLVFSACIVFSRLVQFKSESENTLPFRATRSVRATETILTATTLLVLFGIPVWNLLARASFHVSRIEGKPIGGHSLEQFQISIRRAFFEYLPQTYWSFLIAGGCLLATMTLAVILAGLASQGSKRRALIVFTMSACFALPGPVIGTLLLKIYNGSELPWVHFLFNRTLFPAIAADILVCLPIAFLLIWFVIALTPSDSKEHMRTEGAGGWQTFWQMDLKPNRLPLLGVAVLCFVVAYGDLSSTQMVLPPGVETVPRLTLGLMHAGVNKMTAALTIVNVGTLLVVSAGAWWLVCLKWRTLKQ